MIKLLLEYAKNLNTMSVFNYTPLKYILENLQPTKAAIAIKLIQCGSDCNIIKFNNITNLRGHTSNSQNVNDELTCLEYIFKIYENNFKITQEFKILIELIEVIINSGYKLNFNEMNILKVLPIFNHNSTQRLVFMDYYKSPNLLANICRIKIRSLLNKPYLNSIQSLNIPLFLKDFLYFK